MIYNTKYSDFLWLRFDWYSYIIIPLYIMTINISFYLFIYNENASFHLSVILCLLYYFVLIYAFWLQCSRCCFRCGKKKICQNVFKMMTLIEKGKHWIAIITISTKCFDEWLILKMKRMINAVKCKYCVQDT